MRIATRWLTTLSLILLGAGGVQAATSQNFDVVPGTTQVEFGLLKSEGYQLQFLGGNTVTGAAFVVEPAFLTRATRAEQSAISDQPSEPSTTVALGSTAAPSAEPSLGEIVRFVPLEAWLVIAVLNSLVVLLGIMVIILLRRHHPFAVIQSRGARA